ncbi:hypothetical protein ACFLVG_03525 [Chloroflexota bacterium]
MYLLERLHKLVGHRVSISRLIEVEGQSTTKGILEEAGGEYVMIRPQSDEIGFPEDPGQWIIQIKQVMPIVHLPNCEKCREDEAVEREKAAEREEISKLIDHTISFSGADFDVGILLEVDKSSIVFEPLDAITEIDEHGVEYISLKTVSIDSVKPIIHSKDCKKCELEAVTQSIA